MVAGVWALDGRRLAPGALLLAGVAATVVLARWLTRRGVLSLPLQRAQGVNVEAALPGDTPRVWLCAHLDSKSQPVPTLVRIAGILLESLGILLALVLAIEHTGGTEIPAVYWAIAGMLTLAGAIPVGLSMVGSRSPGALDNASGVATIMAAARRLSGERGVGVLLTDAEELGLAGAMAWGRGRLAVTVLNCDGVDDHGDIAVMRTGRTSQRLVRALARAGPPGKVATIGWHLPGVLTDAVALAHAGHDSVTVSRGSLRSFLRVHSPTDDLSRLRGDGIEPTADYIAAAARHILGGIA
jgi:hypothetical protein